MQHPRAPPAAALRPPRHLRPLRLVPGLPAPRPLQHRGPRAVLADPPGPLRRRARSSSPCGSASRRRPGCTSWCARRSGEMIPDVDARDLERRLHRRRPLVARRLRHRAVTEYGEEHGSRLARTLRRRLPRGLQGGLQRAHPAALDLGRLEAIEPGPDGDGIDLSLYQPVDAGRGEARLKVFRVGLPALAVAGPADAVLDGRRGVDERPYELDGLDRTSYIYEFGLRYAARACPTTAASCSRTRSARSGTATTRSTASTPWCSRPGSPGARRPCCAPTRST